MTVAAPTTTTQIIEELVNQLESFVAKEPTKLYFNIHTQMLNLFLHRMKMRDGT
jgi:hypothetical protein